MSGRAGRLAGRIATTPAARLVVVGAVCTGLYLAGAWTLSERLGLPAGLASLTAYMAAAVVSYFGHRTFTFRSSVPHARSAWRFGLLAVAGYVVALATPLILTDGLGAPAIASFLAVSIAVPAANAVALSRLVFLRSLVAPFAR